MEEEGGPRTVHVSSPSTHLFLGLVCELVDIPYTRSILQDNKHSDGNVDASQFFRTSWRVQQLIVTKKQHESVLRMKEGTQTKNKTSITSTS